MGKRYTYISLFSSAGIGCYGFKNQGFECVATNDILEKRINIQRYNKKCKYETGYIVGDISEISVKKSILKELEYWKNNEKIKELDVLIATPPCQGISVANHKKRSDEIKRNSLIMESIVLTKDIRPNYFIFENVRGFLNASCTDEDGNDKKIEEVILNHLSPIYNILFKVINFKDYGANSSRTRTLVTGVKKRLYDICPFDIFPSKKKYLTLFECIGHLPRLKTIGEIDKNDIYHSFRVYDKRMESWIINTKQGYSAFDNKLLEHRPHKIDENGCLILNQNKNGDKYKRNKWELVAPCIHTRNDILSSQATIHPEDNRVFSIRELMILMNIPSSFVFSDIPEEELNHLSEKDKIKYLKNNELNIRSSIGEAVPTIIFESIAKNIKINENEYSISNINKIILSNNMRNNFDNVISYVKKNINLYPLKFFSKLVEFANIDREKHLAFYTPSNIIYNIVNNLPNFRKDNIYVLEPSVGIGNFIPFLYEKYYDKTIHIDVIDIDGKILKLLKILMSKFYPDINIRYIENDFLFFETDKKYDIVIGNPPYARLTPNQRLVKKKYHNKESNNTFIFFIENAIKHSKIVAFIIPKTFLSSPEYNITRKKLETDNNIIFISDYGEKSFYNVKIETIGIIIDNNTKKDFLLVDSFIKENINIKNKDYVFDKYFNMWFIYVDNFFLSMKKKLKFDLYDFYRDRQITKKILLPSGKYRVLKSRNIVNLKIINIDGYDKYVNSIENLKVSCFMNKESVLIPNLSYAPRACRLPKNSITDGSVAILKPKETVSDLDLEYYSTEEFRTFYMIARNYATRTLNIDSNSIKLWGKVIG